MVLGKIAKVMIADSKRIMRQSLWSLLIAIDEEVSAAETKALECAMMVEEVLTLVDEPVNCLGPPTVPDMAGRFSGETLDNGDALS